MKAKIATLNSEQSLESLMNGDNKIGTASEVNPEYNNIDGVWLWVLCTITTKAGSKKAYAPLTKLTKKEQKKYYNA